MNNKVDTTYYPNMKTAVSSFRFQRTTLKKRLDKYEEQHTKTLREIWQNQRDLTRSLSLESEHSLDKHNIPYRRRARSLYGKEHGDISAAECDDDQHSVTDTVPMLCNKYDRRRKSELSLSYPAVKNQNGKLTASSFLPSKPRSASFITSSTTSNSLAEKKTSQRVLKRQERIENSQESDIQKSLTEQTKNMMVSDLERSYRSSKVNIDALKDQKHDKHKMNLTEKSQQITKKRSVNSLHEVKTAEQKDKEKSLLDSFKNKNPLPTVSKQNANSSLQAESRDNHSIKSVKDISRTVLEPGSVRIKQSLRPTKSLSPLGTRNKTAIKQRSQTFAGETEDEDCYSENLRGRKQVRVNTKNANLNEQYLQGCHRNCWSEVDDNFKEKRLSTPNGETFTPLLQMSLPKQSDVKTCLSSCDDGDKTPFNSTEIEVAGSLIEKDCNASKLMCVSSPGDSEWKEIPESDQGKDHSMRTTPAANQRSEDKLETDPHSLNRKDILNNTAYGPIGNVSQDNQDTRDKKTSVFDNLQSKGWRKLRAIPLNRLQKIGQIREADRSLPVLQDFPVRDSRLPRTPGLMSFRQVVLAAIKKEEDEQTKKKKTGELLISKERLNEIQQPTESFLRQTVDKKIKRYTTHAPRPPSEDRIKRGPEFHAVAKGVQGFQTLSSVLSANRLSRAEKIRKKTTSPHTRTRDVMSNGHKTMREMMEEVKNCRYLRNKDYVT